MKKYMEQPIFLNDNRVYRVYTGGRLLDKFVGNAERKDGNYPEEWVSSTVEAIGNIGAKPDDGLSIIESTDSSLKELGEKYPYEMYGNRKNLGVLVKYLDSAIRLPLQVHPDKAFSEKHFNSEFGKTEMWLVLDTREDASIYFGFKDKITKEEFSEVVEKSKTEKHVFDNYLNRVNVKSGEVYLIPGRAVHAIGAGCLMLEVQEPTDYTLQPEYWCGDHMLSEQEMYMGLPKDIALDCFDYSLYGEESIKSAVKVPVTLTDNDDVKIESLISSKDTPCFSVNRYTVRKKCLLKSGPAIFIVSKGTGVISGDNYTRQIKKGDYFFYHIEPEINLA